MIIETVRQLLGRAIREHRKGGNLTQAQLAERAGISTQTVVLIEGGQRWPEYDNLQRLAAALGVPELALFTWAPPPSPTPQEALAVLARELAARPTPLVDPLAARVSKLSKESRQYVEDLVQGLEDSPPSPEPDKGAAEKRK